MTWVAYLKSKKIDPDRFKKGNNTLFRAFDQLFNQMSPESFTAQKLFLINKLRRMYKLEADEKKPTEGPAIKAKPRIVPKIRK